VLASSAAIAHDVYVNVIKDGNANQRQQVTVARITSLVVGLTATWLGVVCENAPIAQLVSLAFAVAASTNLPVIFFCLFWKRFNAAGIISGLVIGFVVAVGLTLVSPNMTYPKKIAADARKMVDVLKKKQAAGAALSDKELKNLDTARETYAKNKDGKSLLGLDAPLFPLKNPGIISVPAGFLAAIIGCLAFRSRRAEDMFDELYVRQNTGVGMIEAMDH
jgi:cation/acetate symporter